MLSNHNSSHAGLVKEARNHLDSMFDLHGVIPCLEHYACVVNVLGKISGWLLAARELMALQPENKSIFLLLSNLYASAGMWSDVRRLRREMKDKVGYKEPGSAGFK
ncbi:putative pentatricopeptide repeat-containing protein [Tanacetum coccineum]